MVNQPAAYVLGRQVAIRPDPPIVVRMVDESAFKPSGEMAGVLQDDPLAYFLAIQDAIDDGAFD